MIELRDYAETVAELLTDFVRDKVPDRGNFRFSYYTCKIKGTQNEAIMSVEPSALEPGLRIVRAGARRGGTDMMVSNFIKTGTNARLLEYFADPATIDEWVKAIEQRSEKVDEKW